MNLDKRTEQKPVTYYDLTDLTEEEMWVIRNALEEYADCRNSPAAISEDGSAGFMARELAEDISQEM
jgi:hypothetical protein